MDSTLSPKLDKRTIISGGSKRPRVVDESAQAGPSCAASPPLPTGFPLPPAGYESQFEIWARFWRQTNSSDELSIQMQLELCKFVCTVEILEKLGGQFKNNELAHVHELQVCRGRAVSYLRAIVDSTYESMFNEALRRLNIISELYKRTYTEYKSAHDAHILQVKAATEQVEKLLHREAESAATGKRITGIPTHPTMLEGQPQTFVHADETLSIQSGPVRELSDADTICKRNVQNKFID